MCGAIYVRTSVGCDLHSKASTFNPFAQRFSQLAENPRKRAAVQQPEQRMAHPQDVQEGSGYRHEDGRERLSLGESCF